MKFGTFVSYILGKISVKFNGFIRYFKEVRENVSIISEQPSYCMKVIFFSKLRKKKAPPTDTILKSIILRNNYIIVKSKICPEYSY